jgi:hypothetical protein
VVLGVSRPGSPDPRRIHIPHFTPRTHAWLQLASIFHASSDFRLPFPLWAAHHCASIPNWGPIARNAVLTISRHADGKGDSLSR